MNCGAVTAQQSIRPILGIPDNFVKIKNEGIWVIPKEFSIF